LKFKVKCDFTARVYRKGREERKKKKEKEREREREREREERRCDVDEREDCYS